MELTNVKFKARDASDADRRGRWLAGWIPLLALPVIVTTFRARLAPWQFMWALSVAIFFGCKWETWFQASSTGARAGVTRNLGYLLLWPGMDASAFLGSEQSVARPRTNDWIAATLKTFLGCGLVWLAAHEANRGNALVIGWIGMIGLIFALHFGAFHLFALAWQQAGVAAQPLMQSPIRATSLSEFWGQRWNLGFKQLTHRLVFRPVRKRFGTAAATLAAFCVSGLIHDFVISLPAGGGYGLPTGYFLLQGIGVLAERSKIGMQLGIGRGFRGWLFTLLCAGGPAFWLFHPPFVRNVMLPFLAWIGQGGLMRTGHEWAFSISFQSLISAALWMAGIGHFCVLIASFQVPSRLGWREDLPKLTPFNRKLMWVHGGFAVLTIIAFGVLTLALHDEILRGGKAALYLAAFIGVYWTTRIVVDFTYYDHEDWPRGRSFVLGHALLTLLFVFLAATYAAVCVWRVWCS